MKERPILFSAPMVRALLEGRKTQTRRVVKKWHFNTGCEGLNFGFSGLVASQVSPGLWRLSSRGEGGCWQERCGAISPYGKPGDRLWVRESFQPLLRDGVKWQDADYETGDGYEINYVTSGGVKEFYDCSNDEAFCSRITPSIYMPRWASRILLEITDVRVERLQDISEEDAVAEGAFFTNYGRDCFHGYGMSIMGNCPAPDRDHPQRNGWSMVPTASHESCLGDARMAFANYWCKLAGEKDWNVGPAWDANPWVWALSFKVVQP